MVEKENFIRGVGYSFISALCFASLAILVRIGYYVGLDTASMLLMRFFVGTVVFWIFLSVFRKSSLKLTKSLLVKSFLAGSVFYTTQAFCFFKAVKFVSPNVVELLLYMYPAFVTFLTFLFFKDRLTLFKVFYMFIILTGFVFIFHDAFYSKVRLDGVLFGLLAMVVYSFYLVVVQKFVGPEDPLSFSFFTILFTFISFLVFYLLKNKGLFAPTFSQIVVGIFLGVFPTVMAIGFLFAAVKFVGSALVSVFSSVEPVFEIAMSYLILGIKLSFFQFVGGIFILSGVFIANLYHLRVNKGV